jgi:hypothetical protein
MVANPNPSRFAAVDFRERAVVIAYPHRPDSTLQAFEVERRMAGILHPKFVIFPG